MEDNVLLSFPLAGIINSGLLSGGPRLNEVGLPAIGLIDGAEVVPAQAKIESQLRDTFQSSWKYSAV